MPTKTPIEESAAATLKRLEQKDPGLGKMLKKAYAYAVFPSVGKASLVVGGSYGRGAVFERGKFIGHATLSQLTVGVQVGRDTFSEILLFQDKQALDRLKKGKMAFAANASAVLVKAGASGTKDFTNGVAAYAYSRGGMLLEAVIGGQKFSFKSADEQEEDDQARDEESQSRDQRSGRGAKSAKGKASGRGEEEGGEEEGAEDQDEGGGEEQGDGEGEDQESGLLGRALGGVKSAASRVGETAKAHPVATALVGAAATGALFMLMRAARNAADQSDSQGQDEGDEDSDARNQSDEGEEEDQDQGEEEEDDDKGDTLNQLRRRRSRA